jgi:hypothetical protein
MMMVVRRGEVGKLSSRGKGASWLVGAAGYARAGVGGNGLVLGLVGLVGDGGGQRWRLAVVCAVGLVPVVPGSSLVVVDRAKLSARVDRQ